jgi:hypothetical protein
MIKSALCSKVGQEEEKEKKSVHVTINLYPEAEACVPQRNYSKMLMQ